MKTIDLTHLICPEMSVYPGTEGPQFSLASTVEKDKFQETVLSMYSHTGTHVDAPGHVFTDKAWLGDLDIGQFVGSAVVIDCRHLQAGEKITMECIASCREVADKADFLLFCTGWDRYWGTAEYFENYPCIDEEVAQYLVRMGKKGVGTDTISLDPVASLKLHRIVLEGGRMVIVENLTNLASVLYGMFTFCALPLKYPQADGSPIRAIAIKEFTYAD